MKIEAVCEYNDGGYLFYAANYPGAFVRGASEAMALAKFGGEIRSFLRWSGFRASTSRRSSLCSASARSCKSATPTATSSSTASDAPCPSRNMSTARR